MKHYLEAHFNLSGPLPEESKEDIQQFIKEFESKTNETREDGRFEIQQWKSKENKLYLQFYSEDSLSPHVAILRLRKQIPNQFGKKYRIGMRSFSFKKYSIEKEIEEFPIDAFSLPLTKKLEYKEKEGKKWVKIEIDPQIEEDFVEKGAIERIVRRVEEKISKQYYGAKKRRYRAH